MKTRTKVTVASTAIGAILLSGGTYAIWSDTADLDAAHVATGHLDLVTGDQQFFDISAFQRPTGGNTESWEVHDGTPTNITATWSSFVFSPEDAIAVAVPIKVDLEGTNLAAELKASLDREYDQYGFEVAAAGIFEVEGTGAAGAVTDDDLAGIVKDLTTLTDPGTGEGFTAATTNSDVTLPYVFTASSPEVGTQYYAVWTITFDDIDDNGLDNILPNDEEYPDGHPDGPNSQSTWVGWECRDNANVLLAYEDSDGNSNGQESGIIWDEDSCLESHGLGETTFTPGYYENGTDYMNIGIQDILAATSVTLTQVRPSDDYVAPTATPTP